MAAPSSKKSVLRELADGQIKGAPRELLETLFDDYYKNRHKLYWMNLVRGIFFGFGTLVGGTLLVALLLWILSALEYIPFINGLVEAVQKSLERK